MATIPMKAEAVSIAILAKAPIPGLTKTRLHAALGPDGAAALQQRLIQRAAALAVEAGTGPVTLWAAPDDTHPLFHELRARFRLRLAPQPPGDLGARMLAALAGAGGPALVVGTDCPALSAKHLREAADALRGGSDAVVIPVEDGGYALIGLRQPQPALFTDMPWGSSAVMGETRRRLVMQDLHWREPVRLWDIDRPADLDRLRRDGPRGLLD